MRWRAGCAARAWRSISPATAPLALRKALAAPYDVVVLDRDLPEVHGDEVCRTLAAERPDTKVLMLTAAAGVDDLVDGLALGADDYLPKPFRFAELVARTRALARRNGRRAPPVLTAGDVELDPARREATRAGRADRPGAEGARRARGADGRRRRRRRRPTSCSTRSGTRRTDPFTNTVRMTVMTLRRKLGDPPVVHTVRGAGYRV